MAIVIGESEIEQKQLAVKPLRTKQPQVLLDYADSFENESLTMLLNLLAQ